MSTDIFEIENNFYKTTNSKRISKFIFQYEIFKKIKNVKGDVIDFGVLNGSSIFRFAFFSEIENIKKKIYGFDLFKKPQIGKNDISKKHFEKWFNSVKYKMTYKNLISNIKKRKLDKFICLIKGDANKTVPNFFKKKRQISLINLDFDLYYPSKTALEHSWRSLKKNGIIILDNYKIFKGETKAVDEFIKKKKLKKKLKKIKIYRNFYYIKK